MTPLQIVVGAFSTGLLIKPVLVLGGFTPRILLGEFLMMTDPATAIKREAVQLVDLQIETLRQEGRMTDSTLVDYHKRSERIIQLYQQMDRMGRTRIDLRAARAS
jgi:hypothetical protein